MAQRTSTLRNEYRCAIEVNQNGKYCIRLQASFREHDWKLGVYFLSSSFDRAMKKLEQTLQIFQRDEDRLWFWGVDRTDDPKLKEEILSEFGLKLDRRQEFPRRSAGVTMPVERPIPAFMIATLRRNLSDSVSSVRHAAVGD